MCFRYGVTRTLVVCLITILMIFSRSVMRSLSSSNQISVENSQARRAAVASEPVNGLIPNRAGTNTLQNLVVPASIALAHVAARVSSPAHLGLAPNQVPASSSFAETFAVDSGRSEETIRNFDLLVAQAQATGSAKVIVRLGMNFALEAMLGSPSAVQMQRLEIAQAQEGLLRALSASSVKSVKRFKYIPYLAMVVDATGLERLQVLPQVIGLEEDVAYPPALAESVPLIGGTAAWAGGYTGAGQTVAILDTGTDKTHPFLSGKVVSEACYSTNGETTTSVCPGGVSQTTDPGSAIPCSIEGCKHGTHTAGIAAGKATGFSGVAKDANLIAIQVFTQVNNESDCGGSAPCVMSYTSDQILGLERVLELSSSLSIASVNMSLGGGKYSTNCDGALASEKAAIDNLRSVGIATTIASGNGGYTDAISEPACISSAISVGSTDDGSEGTTADVVSEFSNSAPILNLLAPGRWINSSVPGGGYETWPGTSMAAPHVAGAFAVLKSKSPSLNVDQMLAALITTGVTVIDSRNGIAKPRIQLDAALSSLGDLGDTCENPFIIPAGPFPMVMGGTTVGFNNDLATGASCLIADTCGPDVFFGFTPPTSGDYIVWVQGDNWSDNNKWIAYGLGACGSTACTSNLSGAEGPGVNYFPISVTAGTNYRIVLDGQGRVSCSAGTYTLKVGPCSDLHTPGGLAASAISSTSAKINWDVARQPPGTNTALKRYPLGDTQGVIVFSGPDGGGFLDTGLTPGTTYSYRVAAAHSYCGPFPPQSNPVFVTLPTSHILNVAKAGLGIGTVSSNPAGIDCGAACSTKFDSGTQVTLAAQPAADSIFLGWGGEGCSGTVSCVVTMSQTRNVTATFDLVQPNVTLTVTKSGLGTGTVTSNPSGVNCGSTCSAPFSIGTQVTLTPTPQPGSTFGGWIGGGCSATGQCVVTMSISLGVQAVFRLMSELQSTLDGFDPGANELVQALAVQPDGKILVGGFFTTLGGGGIGTPPRNYIGRLNPDGSLDSSFDPGANAPVLTVAVQPDGKILVGGSFTTLGGGGTGTATRNHIGRLNPDGSLDSSFDPGANASVFTMAAQLDGKILVGGGFSTLGGGGTGTLPRYFIGRLNPDGSLDTSFDPGTDNIVDSVAIQPDGKILVGGQITMLGGGGTGTTMRRAIGRLNPNGSLDSSFNPGSDGNVLAMAVQPDGKILVGGGFFRLGVEGSGTTTRSMIGRLNPDGSLDSSFDPGANNAVRALAVQPDGKIVVGGDFTTLGGGGYGTTPRNKIGRLNPNGSLDTTFDPGANAAVFTLAVQPDGKILVGGEFTTLGGGGIGALPRYFTGRLYPDGSLDTSFDPGASGTVLTVAVQPDGKVLLGGWFTTLGGGGTGTTTRSYIGRLNPDGSLDTSFDPGANNWVAALAVQPDGKILVGGSFTTLGGGGTGTTTRDFIGRLNPDGSLDTSFDPGANAEVRALAVQPDGKILVGGYFTTLGGGGTGTVPRNNIGRLNPDGSLDTSFNPGANNIVDALTVQPDGKILVGGVFGTLGGGGTGTTTRRHIGRLNPDGSLELSFDPGANGWVYALAVQPDGRILVGGGFWMLGGGGTGTAPRNNIGRLNPDGSLDSSFDPGANAEVRALAVQADGKILTGGGFTTLGGGGSGSTTRNLIGRLNSDGGLDTNFDPGANGVVVALAAQRDGKILVGGSFTTLGGGGTGTTARNYIGRLPNNEAAVENLGVDSTGSVLTWFRSGAGPEVESVTFESSGDAIIYGPLGVGTRITGGWRLSGVTLPSNQNVFLRARGFFRTGYCNSSGSIVESVREVFLPPSINTVMTAPPPGSTLASSTVTFGWSTGSGVSEYYLQVGTTLGGQELYSVSEGANLSATVMALPTDGSTVYVRLWLKIGGLWSYNDYTYTSCMGCTATKAAMTTPTQGSSLSSSMTTFWWSASLGSECYLQVGTTVGGQEIYSAGQGTNLSVQVPALPTDGSPVYARLWTNVGGVWLYNDYTYVACSGCTATKAVMTSPPSGSGLTASSVTFTWSNSLASQYYLQVGIVPGGQQLYSAGQGTNLSTQVTGLPIGRGNVYVRLWSELGGMWWYNDYSYVACSGCTPTLAVMTTPAPGATLSATVVTFTWGTSLASECYLQVGTSVGGQEIYSAGEGTILSSQVMDLPNNGGAVHVRLWSKIGGAWLFNDYSYTACTGCTATKAAMVTPAPGSTLSSRAATFTWSASLAAEYYLFVGTTVGGQEIYGAGQGTNLSVGVNGFPNNGSTVHARLWSRIGGAWLFNDYTYMTCTGCQ